MLTLSNLSRIEGNARQGSAFSTSMPPSNAYTHAYIRRHTAERREKNGVRNPFFEGSEACLRRHCDEGGRGGKKRDHVFRWELPALEIAGLPLKLARRRTIGLITGHLSAALALPFLSPSLLPFFFFFSSSSSVQPPPPPVRDSCSRGCFSI